MSDIVVIMAKGIAKRRGYGNSWSSFAEDARAALAAAAEAGYSVVKKTPGIVE